MTKAYHRVFAEINLDAVCKNFCSLKSLCNEDVMTMAVVKADAYGHGAVEIANLLRNKADYFAVATLEEGIELRENGILSPVLILAHCSPLQYEQLLEYNIIPTIYNLDEALMLNQCAENACKTATIHIAVDTGMNRIGFDTSDESISAVEKIYNLTNINVEGIFSHYAKADFEDKTSTDAQTALFDCFIEKLEAKNIIIPIKHICNSAGVIDLHKHYNMVRLGIALYGLYPSNEVKKDKIKLIPAMQVFSHVIHVKAVKKGSEIGYGGIYKAQSDRVIATVSIGYADGFKRALTEKGYILINGKRAPITGKVCMDQIMVDVTDIENVKVGTLAVIMGKSENEYLSAEILGELSHSFCYEIVCTFTKRVTRIYRTGE